MQIIRIGVFYDGEFFRAGNVYFRYHKDKRGRQRGWIDFSELHALLERYISKSEKVPVEFTKVVQAHFYGGRVSTEAARDGQLEKERGFELGLVEAGVVPHFLSVRETPKDETDPDKGYRLSQKGVDVNIALDCLEVAFTGQFDVCVLITGDEDFLPLVRKLTGLGKRVLIAYFDFDEWEDERGKKHRATKCSYKLRNAASYTLNFNAIVDDANWKNDIKALFFKPGGE